MFVKQLFKPTTNQQTVKMQDTDFGEKLRLYSQHSFQALLCAHFADKSTLADLQKHLMASAMQGKYECSYQVDFNAPLHEITLQPLDDENLFEQAAHHLVVDLLQSQPHSLAMTNGGRVDNTVTLLFSWKGQDAEANKSTSESSLQPIVEPEAPSSVATTTANPAVSAMLPASSRRIQQAARYGHT